jgi:hypothetical protein
MRTLSTRALTSLMVENTDEVWLPLLTVTHPSLTSPLYVVSNNENVTSNGHTFIGLPFELILPEQSQEQLGSMQVSVPNVDGTIIALIRPLIDPPIVSLQVVLAATPNTIEFELDGLIMRDVQYDAGDIHFSLRFDDLLSEPLCEIQTPDRFPALF